MRFISRDSFSGERERDRILFQHEPTLQNIPILGVSPGLVVMGGGSCSEGCGFESHPCILDGHFSYLRAVKIVMFIKTKKRPGMPF